MEIRVHFFGDPKIFVDGQWLIIPQKKIMALFLLLLFYGRSTRDELTAKLWPDYSPDDAKRNLRNGLYKLKNAVGQDVISTGGNTYVQINPAISVIRDIDVFITENSELLLLDIEEFAFLEKFSLPRCPEFEDWQSGIQLTYDKMLRERLGTALKNSGHNGDFELAERFAEKLLRIEPYSEEAVSALMEIYLKRKRHHKAILIYKSYESWVLSEFGEQPGARIRELYHQALGLDSPNAGLPAKSHAEEDGERSERGALSEEYRKYLALGQYRGCVICGATGSGKALIIRNFIQDEKIRGEIRLACSPVESKVDFWAAEMLAARLSELIGVPYPPAEGAPVGDIDYLRLLRELLEQIGNLAKKTVVLLPRMEYIDAKSLPILLLTLFGERQGAVFSVGSYSDDMRSDDDIPQALASLPGDLLITQKPLSDEQVKSILCRRIIDSEDMEAIFPTAVNFAQGNQMLLLDFVETGALSAETQARLRELCDSFSAAERRVMNCLSICDGGADIELLGYMADMEADDLLASVDGLTSRGVVAQEQTSRGITVKTGIEQLRAFICRELTPSRCAGLHLKAGRLFESRFERMPKNYFVLDRLKYHFGGTDLEYEKFLYTLIELEYLLDYTDEFFPTIKTLDSTKINFSTDRGKLYRQYSEYEDRLSRIEDRISQEQLGILKMHFFFLIGRTLNRDGRREQGIVYIRELTRLAEMLGRKDYQIKSYLETACYGLKCDDTALMRECVEILQDMSGIETYETDYGKLLRLEGLMHRKNGEYVQAEKCLYRSIEIFDSPRLRNRNFINIAAAYDYLGDVYREQGDYKNAEQFYFKAINLCENKNIRKSLDLFYGGVGYTVFLEKDYSRAEKYLRKSLQLYNEFGTYWLRSIAESCLAMIELSRGNHAAALDHYYRADIFGRKEAVIEEVKVLEQAKLLLQEHGML